MRDLLYVKLHCSMYINDQLSIYQFIPPIKKMSSPGKDRVFFLSS